MITFLTGLPRTGKSYRAVWHIKKTFIDSKSDTYQKHHFLYTNIGGLKIDEINNTLADSDHRIIFDGYEDEEGYHQPVDLIKKIVFLDWNYVYPHFVALHKMALSGEADENLIRYARYHKLSPASFVIDEAYLFYTKKSDPVLVWLNAYHGHLGLDILFIIHRPSLMHTDYRAHCEEFIDAQAISKSLTSNTFRYFHYATDTYTKDLRYASDKLIADPAIFALYKSGDLHKPKKILYKYIGFMLGALFFIAFIAYFFLGRMDDRVHPAGSSSVSVNPNDPVSVSPKTSVSSSMLLRVRCNELYCCRVDPAFQTNYIPKLYFDEIMKLIDFKDLGGSTINFFGDVYNDKLYSIPSDAMIIFSMWNIPLHVTTLPPQPLFNSVTGDTP